MRLKNLAENFHDACKLKNDIVGSFKIRTGLATIEETQKLLGELNCAENTVTKMKKKFWDAHAIAKKAGFWTMKKTGDYLQLK